MSWFALDPYLSLVGLDDPMDNGEAKSSSRLLRGEVRVKYMLEILFRDACARVLYGDFR